MGNDNALPGFGGELEPPGTQPDVLDEGYVMADFHSPLSRQVSFRVRSDASVVLGIVSVHGVVEASVMMSREAWELLKNCIDRAWP